MNRKVFLFGPPHILSGNETVHFSRKKTIGAIAYLTVHQRSFSRDRLASLFWPDSDYSHAHANLRKVLFEIRSLCGQNVLPASYEVVGPLDLNSIWVDVHEFQSRSESLRQQDFLFIKEGFKGDTYKTQTYKEDLQAAIDLYTDDFLSGVTLLDCDVFDEWQFLYGENLKQTLSTNLEEMAILCEYQNELDTAIRTCRRLIEIDSLNERAHRTLIRLFLKSGQNQAALRQYRQCEQILDQELGVQPEQTTVELLSLIRESTHINNAQLWLPKIPYSQGSQSHRSQGNREVRLDDVEKIIRHVHMNTASFRENSPANPLVLRSKELCVLGDLTLRSSVYHDGNILRARKYYGRAIQINPRCSDGYAGLAFSFFSLGGYGVDARVNERRKVKVEQLLKRALQYDPGHSRALMVLAGKKMEWDWDMPTAENYFSDALRNNPDYADNLLWYAELLMSTGRFKEAYPMLQRALQLHPTDIAINYRLAKYYFRTGMYSDSLRLLHIIDELYPDRYLVLSLLTFILLAQGDYRGAVRSAEHVVSLEKNGYTLAELSIARAFTGKIEAAEDALKKSKAEHARLGGEDAYFVALALHTLKRDTEALEWLEQAYHDHDISLLKLCTEPLWSNLHWNARFQQLVRRIGLPLCLDYIKQAVPKIAFPEGNHPLRFL
ncbi:MAG: tetratricopeptide repeat protein [Spirochaetaceae bacterium]|nr:tetratricopeptide repeat protein [Spirochaetaceae bacterium]MCF7950247.1 tetratricopeptide repeat protein [Spirochaetaceae bacterium]